MTYPEVDMGDSPGKLMLVGDSHHNPYFLKMAIRRAQEQGVDTIFQLGDFGFWPDGGNLRKNLGYFLSKVQRYLEEREIRMFWIDGNHENHGKLTPGLKLGPIQHVPRGHRWQWWDKTWMAVGGAVSPDKDRRTPGHDWFPEESLSLAQTLHCVRDGGVDIILSHDCPDKVDIPGLHPYRFHPDCIRDSELHRIQLGGIVDSVGAKWLWHGHYHTYHRALRNSDGHKTYIMGLDRDHTPLHLSTFTFSGPPPEPV